MGTEAALDGFMRVAILMANTDESDFAQRHPKDGQKFTELMALARPGWAYDVYAVKDREFPAELDAADGYLITGSPASVNEPASWKSRLERLVVELSNARVPLYGACFGHQIIAKALGGRVSSNPQGWEKGVRIAKYEGEALAGFASHSEQVLSLPEGAETLASAPGCPIAAFRIGAHIETTQYHPEMTLDFFTALLEELGPSLPAGVASEAWASLDTLPDRAAWAARIARFFEAGIAARKKAA